MNKLVISHNAILAQSGKLIATMNSVSLSNALRRDYQQYFAAAPEMADLLREIAQLPQLLDGTDRSAVVITSDLRQRIGEVLLRLNGYDEWPY